MPKRTRTPKYHWLAKNELFVVNRFGDAFISSFPLTEFNQPKLGKAIWELRKHPKKFRSCQHFEKLKRLKLK